MFYFPLYPLFIAVGGFVEVCGLPGAYFLTFLKKWDSCHPAMCPSLWVAIEPIGQFNPEWQSTALKDTGRLQERKLPEERCRWESLLWEKLQFCVLFGPLVG